MGLWFPRQELDSLLGDLHRDLWIRMGVMSEATPEIFDDAFRSRLAA